MHALLPAVVRRVRRRALAALALVVAVGVLPGPAGAGEVVVAVAANFAAPLGELARAFEATADHTVVASPGATGALYTQIRHGAPFDVFLAADRERPARLVADGLAESAFTYATGRLVVWSRDPDAVDGPEALRGPGRIAIGNPETAPYGAAALEALDALGLREAVVGRLVRGQNVAQAFQFAATGNARFAFVGPGQLVGRSDGSRWTVPAELHRPLRQDGVLLRRSADRSAAVAFVEFLQSERARGIVSRHGYGVE